jgi:hypothetical protein
MMRIHSGKNQIDKIDISLSSSLADLGSLLSSYCKDKLSLQTNDIEVAIQGKVYSLSEMAFMKSIVLSKLNYRMGEWILIREKKKSLDVVRMPNLSYKKGFIRPKFKNSEELKKYQSSLFRFHFNESMISNFSPKISLVKRVIKIPSSISSSFKSLYESQNGGIHLLFGKLLSSSDNVNDDAPTAYYTVLGSYLLSDGVNFVNGEEGIAKLKQRIEGINEILKKCGLECLGTALYVHSEDTSNTKRTSFLSSESVVQNSEWNNIMIRSSLLLYDVVKRKDLISLRYVSTIFMYFVFSNRSVFSSISPSLSDSSSSATAVDITVPRKEEKAALKQEQPRKHTKGKKRTKTNQAVIPTEAAAAAEKLLPEFKVEGYRLHLQSYDLYDNHILSLTSNVLDNSSTKLQLNGNIMLKSDEVSELDNSFLSIPLAVENVILPPGVVGFRSFFPTSKDIESFSSSSSSKQGKKLLKQFHKYLKDLISSLINTKNDMKKIQEIILQLRDLSLLQYLEKILSKKSYDKLLKEMVSLNSEEMTYLQLIIPSGPIGNGAENKEGLNPFKSKKISQKLKLELSLFLQQFPEEPSVHYHGGTTIAHNKQGDDNSDEEL